MERSRSEFERSSTAQREALLLVHYRCRRGAFERKTANVTRRHDQGSAMIRYKEIAFVAYPVTDIGRAREFYDARALDGFRQGPNSAMGKKVTGRRNGNWG
jgi:hypothetical protein